MTVMLTDEQVVAVKNVLELELSLDPESRVLDPETYIENRYGSEEDYERHVQELAGALQGVEDSARARLRRRRSDAQALDELNLMLSAREWPGASALEDVCVVVRSTGREEVADAPEWDGH